MDVGRPQASPPSIPPKKTNIARRPTRNQKRETRNEEGAVATNSRAIRERRGACRACPQSPVGKYYR